MTQFTPGRSSVGVRIDQPLVWLLKPSCANTRTSAANASARVPMARLTPASLRTGNATSAPAAAPASAPINAATRKLSCPWLATNGRSNPQS